MSLSSLCLWSLAAFTPQLQSSVAVTKARPAQIGNTIPLALYRKSLLTLPRGSVFQIFF